MAYRLQRAIKLIQDFTGTKKVTIQVNRLKTYGVEFMALLFLLVYAGAIAVLVLFVVMMLDVKAIENPWSVNQKRFFLYRYFFILCLFDTINK